VHLRPNYLDVMIYGYKEPLYTLEPLPRLKCSNRPICCPVKEGYLDLQEKIKVVIENVGKKMRDREDLVAWFNHAV
jgi:hypothetical protein